MASLGERTKYRWNNIHTMAEAKAGLKCLLNWVLTVCVPHDILFGANLCDWLFSRLWIFAGYFPLYLPLMGREKTNRNFPDALLLEKISRFHFWEENRPFAYDVTLGIIYLLKFSNILNFDKMLKYYLSKKPYFICCFLSHIGLYTRAYLLLLREATTL